MTPAASPLAPPPAATLIRGAAILTLDAADRFIPRGHLLVRGGAIEAVGAGDWTGDGVPDAPPPEVIEGAGFLVAPGLVNAHTHSQSSTLAGFGDRLSHPAFMWLTQAHTSRRTPAEIRLAVLLTAYGLLASGTTALIDHFPGQRVAPHEIDAVMAAWEETGLRATLGLRFFDGAFADILPAPGVLGPDLAEAAARLKLLDPVPLGELRGLMEGAIAAWHGRGGRLAVFPAPSNPDRCSDAALLLCAELAEAHDTGVHTHLLETRTQARLAREAHGVGAAMRLERLGVLSDRWSCAHCVWPDDEEIDLLASRGVVAVLNPESNARLGVGLAPIPALRDRGVRLALGTDGAGANDNLVLHEAMRAVAGAHRGASGDRATWVSAREALAMATAGGAAALRVPGLGTLAPGRPADLVLYDLDAPWWVPMNDPVTQLVFAETGAGVDTVMVAGRVLYRGGRPTVFDAGDLAREVRAMTGALRSRNADLFAIAERIAELAP